MVLLWVLPRRRITRDDITRVVKAIEYFFFVYTDRAREFDARVMEGKDELARVDLRLHTSSTVG